MPDYFWWLPFVGLTLAYAAYSRRRAKALQGAGFPSPAESAPPWLTPSRVTCLLALNSVLLIALRLPLACGNLQGRNPDDYMWFGKAHFARATGESLLSALPMLRLHVFFDLWGPADSLLFVDVMASLFVGGAAFLLGRSGASSIPTT